MREAFSEKRECGSVAIGFAEVSPDGDAALTLFDAAIAVADPDEALLFGTPAAMLITAMTAVVIALQHVNPERVMRKQGWFHRFTGADLEARLQFEVSIKTIGDQMRDLGSAALHAEGTLHLLEREINKLDAASASNEKLILAVREALSRPSAGDTTRLERRLGNLEALHASHRLARAQMTLSIDHLNDLLDRFRDIEQLLFPVWQQHALAVAQSATAGQVSALDSAQSSLARALRRNKEAV